MSEKRLGRLNDSVNVIAGAEHSRQKMVFRSIPGRVFPGGLRDLRDLLAANRDERFRFRQPTDVRTVTVPSTVSTTYRCCLNKTLRLLRFGNRAVNP